MTHAATNSRRSRAFLLSAVLASVLASACACPDKVDSNFPDDDARESALESFALLKHAVEKNLVNRFYYLQEHTVRDRIPYHVLATRWDEIRPALMRGIAQATVLDVTELTDEADRKIPHGPNAIVRIQRPDADGELIEESLLFVLEVDPARWPNEYQPRWRVRVPWHEFPSTDPWFAALGVTAADAPDGAERDRE